MQGQLHRVVIGRIILFVKRFHPILCAGVVAISAICGQTFAFERTLDLEVGRSVEFFVDSPVDDSNLRDPSGYEPGEIHNFFNRRITIKNMGVNVLRDVHLVVGKRDFTTFEGISSYLRFDDDESRNIGKLISFWNDASVHATSQIIWHYNPFVLLNFFGCGICGENAPALAQLFSQVGISYRRVPLSGHVAFEYLFDDKWNVVDGNRKAVFLTMDGRHFASADEILEDPFLALRTKVDGVNSRYDYAAASGVASMFQRSNEKVPPLPVYRDLSEENWMLYPGEEVTYYYNKSPDVVIGEIDIDRWEGVRDARLGIVEMKIDPARRFADAGDGEAIVRARYPIYEVRYRLNGELHVERFANNFVFPGLKLKQIPGIEGPITILCQGAKQSFPYLSKGENSVLLEGAGGRAEVTFVTNDYGIVLPEAEIINRSDVFDYARPAFQISAPDSSDMMWLQISKDSDFSFVLPNFDIVAGYKPAFKMSPLSETFFDNNEKYYSRVKVRRGELWSDWSNLYEFSVKRPERPINIAMKEVKNGFIGFSWSNRESDTEYLVFGSNRLDFVPEVYCTSDDIIPDPLESALIESCTEELVELKDHSQVIKTRPNRSLIAKTVRNSVDVPLEYPIYRVVARRGESLSPPSDIIRVPAEMLKEYGIDRAKVLNTNHVKVKADNDLGYTETYITTERPLAY